MIYLGPILLNTIFSIYLFNFYVCTLLKYVFRDIHQMIYSGYLQNQLSRAQNFIDLLILQMYHIYTFKHVFFSNHNGPGFNSSPLLLSFVLLLSSHSLQGFNYSVYNNCYRCTFFILDIFQAKDCCMSYWRLIISIKYMYCLPTTCQVMGTQCK